MFQAAFPLSLRTLLQLFVVDEIGSKTEAAAVKDIAQRGVATVGTAHGVSLKSVLKNPEPNALVGGVHQVIIGDAAAKYAKYRTQGRSLLQHAGGGPGLRSLAGAPECGSQR